jgi:hypothetical protein
VGGTVWQPCSAREAGAGVTWKPCRAWFPGGRGTTADMYIGIGTLIIIIILLLILL